MKLVVLVIGIVTVVLIAMWVVDATKKTEDTVRDAQDARVTSPALFKCQQYCLSKCNSLLCTSSEDQAHACTGKEFTGLEGNTRCSAVLDRM